MTNELYDTRLPNYNEAAALQQLLQTMHITMEADCQRMDADHSYDGCEQITITIGGMQTAFYLGGPQADGLYAFVHHIAAENFYEVDIDRGTVSD